MSRSFTLLTVLIFLTTSVTIHAGINQWTQMTPSVPDIVVSLAVHPEDGSLFAGRWPGGAYISRDNGVSWKHIEQVMPDSVETAISTVAPAILIHPQNPDVIYIGTLSGGWRSNDRGDTWVEVLDQMVYALVFDPKDPDVIYAGTAEGIFKSLDGGNSWKQSSEGLKNEKGILPYIHAIKIDPENSDNLYSIASQRTRFGFFVSIDKPPTLPPDKESLWGLFRSTDGGNYWYRVGEGIPDRTESYIPIDASYLWGDLAIDASDPSVIYFFSAKDLFKSKNSGTSFEKITPVSGIEEGFSGLDRFLVVNTNKPEILIYGFDRHIYQSDDLGQSWRPLSKKLPFELTEGIVIVVSSNPLTLMRSSAGKLWSYTQRETDFNGDGTTNFHDFILFVSQFGKERSDEDFDARFDLDDSGVIDFPDFLGFANGFN